jgi:hypothetical protein
MVMKPAVKAERTLSSVPSRNTVRMPPPERPPHPRRAEFTSGREARYDRAAMSSARVTPGQLVPAENRDFATSVSCWPANAL